MKNSQSLITWGVVLLMSATLVACGGSGGGGGGGTAANRVPTVTGPVHNTASDNDAEYTITESDLLANASDADGDSLRVSALAIASGDASGVMINGTSIDVSPSAYNGFTVADSEQIELTYTISDNNGGSVNTSVEITINGANDAPTRVALSNISVSDGQPSAGGYVVGTLYTDDPENDVVTYDIAGGSDAGNFSVSGNQLVIDDGILFASGKDQYQVTVRAIDTGGASIDVDLTILVIESQPLTVGYYDILQNNGRPEQATPITFIGETAVNVGDIDSADLSGLDMLFVQNPISSVPFGPYIDVANLTKVANFVSNGGILIFHDRHADTIESILPGSPGQIVADLGVTRTEFEVIDDLTHLAQGPGGIIDDTNLESANSLSFGYVDAATTPLGSVGYLSRNDSNHWISYAYPVDRGYVIYSTIPLDFYLLNGNPDVMRSIYAPNILAQARALLNKAPDDDGDGLLNVEETVLGTDPNNDDSDGDGLLDLFEVRNGFDALTGGDESVDTDNDGLTNLEEQMAGTQPRQVDSDNDGLNDGDEVNNYGTDPLSTDTDGDLLSDAEEVNTYATDPSVADTDAGGTEDGREVFVDGTDPLDGSDDLATVALPHTLNDSNNFIWDIQQAGFINNGSSDAYDGGMRLFVDGTAFPNFSQASELQNGREVQIGLANMSGLLITRRVYIPDNHAFARFMEVLNNPSSTDIDVQIQINTNLGSDGNSIIVRTSDGDTAIEPVDFYVVTDDTSNGGGDPSLAHVYAGPNASVTPVVTAPLGSIIYTYDVTVPANSRVILLHFDSQNANRTVAIASADYLLGLGDGTLDGMSVEDLQDVVNFDLSGVTATSSTAQTFRYVQPDLIRTP